MARKYQATNALERGAKADPEAVDREIFGDSVRALSRATITDDLWDLGAVRLHPTGLVFVRDLTEDEWMAFGKQLGFLEGGIQWWIGDWMQYGEFQWGTKLALAAAVSGRSVKRVQQWQGTAKAFEMSRRRDILSYSHHELLTYISPAEQEHWLDWCAETGASVADLKAAMREHYHASLQQLDAVEALTLPAARNAVETFRVLTDSYRASILDVARGASKRERKQMAEDLRALAEDIERA